MFDDLPRTTPQPMEIIRTVVMCKQWRSHTCKLTRQTSRVPSGLPLHGSAVELSMSSAKAKAEAGVHVSRLLIISLGPCLACQARHVFSRMGYDDLKTAGGSGYMKKCDTVYTAQRTQSIGHPLSHLFESYTYVSSRPQALLKSRLSGLIWNHSKSTRQLYSKPFLPHSFQHLWLAEPQFHLSDEARGSGSNSNFQPQLEMWLSGKR